MNSTKMNGQKLRVGVLFGGRSSEHNVSVVSAKSVMTALRHDRYEVVPILITKAGQWLRCNSDEMAERDDPTNGLPDYARGTKLNVPLPLLNEGLDVIIPILHGPFGEDGTIQGLLEVLGLPYVGAGVLGSAVGMDKATFKDVMTAHNLPIMPWRLIRDCELSSLAENPDRCSSAAKDRGFLIENIEAQFRFPVFTKPANLGSSVGIRKCCNREELLSGLQEAAQHDRRLIVEQGLDIRELEVAVLGNDDPVASVVGEIRPKRGFYDYDAKYVSNDTELLIPAQVGSAITEQARHLAVEVFRAIDCSGMGRVDLFLDPINDTLYVNEINTIPGFTSISMFPKLWAASGLAYPDLLDRLIELALGRFDRKRMIPARNHDANSDETAKSSCSH